MKFEIPKEAVIYIIYQRTKYLKEKTIFKILNIIGAQSPFLYKLSVWLKAKLYNKQIVSEFKKDILNDFDMIKEHLPNEVENILDIGSGISGIDIILGQNYKKIPNIHLLDKTALDTEIYYGFNPKTAYYNSLELAKKILISNSIPESKIYLHDADNPNNTFEKKVYQLVVSFISWGFHYPVDMYLDKVYQSLDINGVLILDIRKNSDGLQKIKNKFSQTKILHEYNSHQRILAIK